MCIGEVMGCYFCVKNFHCEYAPFDNMHYTKIIKRKIMMINF